MIREIIQRFPNPDKLRRLLAKKWNHPVPLHSQLDWLDEYSQALIELVEAAPTLGVLSEADIKAAYMDYYEGRQPTTEEIQAIEEYARDHAESGNTWLWDVVDALNGKGDLPR